MSAEDIDRQVVRKFCEAIIRRLRGILRRNPPKSSPCSSCAFGPHSEKWKGFETTIWNLTQAIMNGRPFYCHHGMKLVDGEFKPDPAHMVPCANFEAIRRCPETPRAIYHASVESHETER